jgi:hypothetical protein
MPAPPTASPEEIRDVNTRYHDGAAAQYDAKWGIDFGKVGRHQVLGKLRKALGRELPVFDHALEIGAGTGYFALHLLMAGVVRRVTCTDISPGCSRRCGPTRPAWTSRWRPSPATPRTSPPRRDLRPRRRARRPAPPPRSRPGVPRDAPGAPAGRDRVLRGRAEPRRRPHRHRAQARRGLGRAGLAGAHQRPPRAAGHSDGGEANHQLEGLVDVHAFVPDDLSRGAVRAGLTRVEVRGEELLANWFGWANRALESTAEQDDVPWLWRQYAYRGYLLLQEVDRRVLESRLPPAIFYNLMLSARKPG